MKSGRRDATALAGSGQTDKRSVFASERTDIRQEVIASQWIDKQEVCFANVREQILYIGGKRVFLVVER